MIFISSDKTLKLTVMNKFEHMFYRNNRPLTFIPTIVLCADNGRYTYQPYVFRQVDYVHNINEVKSGTDMYFVLKHDIYNSDKLDKTMELIEVDLKSGYYFPFGELPDSPFKEFWLSINLKSSESEIS